MPRSLALASVLVLGIAARAAAQGRVHVVHLADTALVRLSLADTLEVTLQSNPSTGYAWSVVDSSATRLRRAGHEFFADPVPKGWVGGGGMERFRFVPRAAGESRLLLYYARGSGAASAVMAVRIEVAGQ